MEIVVDSADVTAFVCRRGPGRMRIQVVQGVNQARRWVLRFLPYLLNTAVQGLPLEHVFHPLRLSLRRITLNGCGRNPGLLQAAILTFLPDQGGAGRNQCDKETKRCLAAKELGSWAAGDTMLDPSQVEVVQALDLQKVQRTSSFTPVVPVGRRQWRICAQFSDGFWLGSYNAAAEADCFDICFCM